MRSFVRRDLGHFLCWKVLGLSSGISFLNIVQKWRRWALLREEIYTDFPSQSNLQTHQYFEHEIAFFVKIVVSVEIPSDRHCALRVTCDVLYRPTICTVTDSPIIDILFTTLHLQQAL
jgi:hypothetical protein